MDPNDEDDVLNYDALGRSCTATPTADLLWYGVPSWDYIKPAIKASPRAGRGPTPLVPPSPPYPTRSNRAKMKFSRAVVFLFLSYAIQVTTLPTPEGNRRGGKWLSRRQRQESKRIYLISSLWSDILQRRLSDITGRRTSPR